MDGPLVVRVQGPLAPCGVPAWCLSGLKACLSISIRLRTNRGETESAVSRQSGANGKP